MARAPRSVARTCSSVSDTPPRFLENEPSASPGTKAEMPAASKAPLASEASRLVGNVACVNEIVFFFVGHRTHVDVSLSGLTISAHLRPLTRHAADRCRVGPPHNLDLEREVVIVVSHRRSHDLESVRPSIHPRNTRLHALTRHEFVGQEVMLKALHEHRRHVADIASPAPHIVVVQHADESCRRPLHASIICRPPMTRLRTMISFRAIARSLRTQISNGSPSPRRAAGASCARVRHNRFVGQIRRESGAEQKSAEVDRREDTRILYQPHTSSDQTA